MKKASMNNRHKIQKLLVIISIILLLVYSLRVTSIFDEDYSLTLANNTFSKIISFDSLDVHPPLYYFLLKIFLNLTTFWTSSFFIKTLFARLLTIIFSLITFVFLYKTLKLVHLKVSIYTQWLLFLLIPGVISFTYQFIKIRMYSLSAMFIVIDFYELMKFNNTKRNRYLILVLIISILTFYTNYYAAFIIGIILLIYMIKYFFMHKRTWIDIFTLGTITAISFLPWIPIFMKQLTLQNNHPQGSLYKQWIATVILILLFIYPLLWSYKNLNKRIAQYFFLSFLILIILFVFMSIVSVLDQPVFAFRYIYPIYLIYAYFGINISYLMLKTNKIIVISLIGICTLITLCGYINQFNEYTLTSIKIVKQFNYWKYTNRYDINLKHLNNTRQDFNIMRMILLSNIHKHFYTPTSDKYIYSNVSYKKMFNNISKYMINK